MYNKNFRLLVSGALLARKSCSCRLQYQLWQYRTLRMVIAVICYVSVIFMAEATAIPVFADSLFDTAPLNAKFQDYIDDPRAEPVFDDTGNYFGFIPLPFEQEKHRAPTGLSKAVSLFKATLKDPVYDMRDPDNDGDISDSLLSPVKSQGECGSCWAFASLDVLESYLKGNNINYNLSENNLVNRHGFDPGPCDGGNILFTSAYMSGYRGVVTEEDDPYRLKSSGAYCTTCKPVRYIDNIILLPVRYDINDNEYIKQNIIDHGALYTSIYYDNDNYLASDATYYYNDMNNSFDDSNHAVVIVGWDDNKFVDGISKKGAFIVKNSWGDDWGDNGYFYVSYYDESIAFSTLAFFDDFDDQNESRLQFNKIYQHDEIGWTGSGLNTDSGWGANWFVPDNNGILNAVSFAATNSNLSYEIVIYDEIDEVDNTFSNVIATQTGNIENEGWYTIVLNTPVALTMGDGFAVAVRFTTPGRNYPIPLERKIEAFSSNITLNPGESYVSGNGEQWFDTYDFDYRVCIKALVQEEQEDCGPGGCITPCQNLPSPPDIAITMNGVRANIFWPKDSYCDETTYTLYYADYPFMDNVNMLNMGNKTVFSRDFTSGSSYYVVVYAKNSKGYAASDVKIFEIKCSDKQICSMNKPFIGNSVPLDQSQATVNANWDIVTMTAEEGMGFLNEFYSRNPDLETHLSGMNITLLKDAANIMPLKKSVWRYEIIKGKVYNGDLYFGNELLISQSGTPALATVDHNGNQGLTFYGELPYGGAGFITVLTNGECSAYFFLEFMNSSIKTVIDAGETWLDSSYLSGLSGKYRNGCSVTAGEYFSMTACPIETPVIVSFINADGQNVQSVKDDSATCKEPEYIRFDYLFPKMDKPVDIYVLLYTPSGQLLFMDDKADFTTESGKAFKLSAIDTIRKSALFKKSAFQTGSYKVFWLITPANGGDIYNIDFDSNNCIFDSAGFSI